MLSLSTCAGCSLPLIINVVSASLQVSRMTSKTSSVEHLFGRYSHQILYYVLLLPNEYSVDSTIILHIYINYIVSGLYANHTIRIHVISCFLTETFDEYELTAATIISCTA